MINGRFVPYHVVICSHTHLCRNPRVLKEAHILAKVGYQISILTAIYSDELLAEDKRLLEGSNIRYFFYSDLRQKNVKTIFARAVRRIAVFLQYTFSVESCHSLGYNVSELKHKSVKANADLYICHQELPTCIGSFLIKNGKKIAFDIEDWYSEDLLPEARKQRPVKLLKRVECHALKYGAYCTTTSHSLANELATAYKANTSSVIYNVFSKPEAIIEKQFKQPLKLFWFSQTIGAGRGLEPFISVLNSLVTPVELHLLGAISVTYHAELETLIPHQHKLFFHQLVPETELAEYISRFDIGLALEQASPPSRNFTITNKFFQYLQAGLPIIATRTAGQMEAFEKYQPGILINLPATQADIANLNNWLNTPEMLQEAARSARAAALEYNWENESEKLLQLVAGALND